jgi:hypothetical protein
MSDESEEIERKRIAEHESEENIYTIYRFTEQNWDSLGTHGLGGVLLENLSDGISTLPDFSSANLTSGSVLGPLAGGRGDSAAAFECCLASAADAIAYQPQPSRCGLYTIQQISPHEADHLLGLGPLTTGDAAFVVRP